jgi:hypothetical protein
MNKLK